MLGGCHREVSGDGLGEYKGMGGYVRMKASTQQSIPQPPSKATTTINPSIDLRAYTSHRSSAQHKQPPSK